MRVGFPRVPSSFTDPYFIPDLPESFHRFLLEQKPNDVIIVDGTADSYSEGKSRFPRSMQAWLNWFRAKELDFQTAHWLPNPREQVIIGKQTLPYSPSGNEGDYIILVNPVIDPKSLQSLQREPIQLFGHHPAYFDDPDQAADKRLGWPFLFNLLSGHNRIVFSSYGAQRLYKNRGYDDGQDEAILIKLVQQHMELVLPEMLQKIQT